MKRIMLFSFLFAACVSGQYREPVSAETSSFYVNIANKTMFDISILTEDRLIPGGTSKDIQLPIQRNQLTEGYQLTCYVTIADDVIKAVPLENKIIKREEKNITIEPDDIRFVSNESLFVVTNETNSVIRVRRTNSDTYRSGLGPGTNSDGTRIELRPGKTNVYLLDAFSCSIQNERNVLFAMPSNIREEGFVNYFVFDGAAVTLTDSRPLHRIGEDSWSKTINDAAGTMPLVAGDGEINLFAATKSGVIRTVFDTAGNVKRQVSNGDSFVVTFAGKAADGFFIAGYEKLSNGTYRPIARINSIDGGTRYILNHSEEYMARFFTAAQKDNATWLLAGDGTKRVPYDNTASAYARLVRLENDKLTPVWEISPGTKCGKIKSALYDNARHCWFVSGENIEFDTMGNQIAGSYIARIRDDGTIQNIDYSFKDMSFYKILTGANGTCYLAGEEQRGNETYAILVTYNVNDTKFQPVFTQAASHSYYHDALLDAANNRVVLAGVMKAADETGRGGVPFVDAVDIQKESLVWREELSNPEIKGAGAVLVTTIVPAPDYGFVLALSGIGGTTGYYEKPYMIARVNSQGKYYMEARK